MRNWLIRLLGGVRDFGLMQHLHDRNELLEARHKEVLDGMALIDGLMSSNEHRMAQAQLRTLIIRHRSMR